MDSKTMQLDLGSSAPEFEHVMVDIETLDTVNTAVVLSIGAVAFDPYSDKIGEKFYVEFSDPRAQQLRGRTVNYDTVKWWMQQARENIAATLLFAKSDDACRVQTPVGLMGLSEFFARHGGKKMKLWGNGSDFDNVIIGSLYESFGIQRPWSYSTNRCYRTEKSEHGSGVPVLRHGTHHNGLDDAITQAKHLQEINRCRANK